MKYRAEIDGLRALAVVPVILFHAGFELFNGGFVGVDVFFVISGYLITTILINDIENNRFSIVNFYERRARRILPALFFVILVCIPFAWFWMLPSQIKDFSQSLVAVSLFSSNILFWLESGYFAAVAEEKPLIHTWSLAVEEQYYVLFPLFLIFAWRFGKNRVFGMIVVMAGISLLLSEWGWRNETTANFYLSPTRAWELLAGSITAFVLQKKGVQKNNVLSLLGLAAIIFSIFVYDETTPFPSVYALVPVIGVVLLIFYAEKETLAARLLSTKIFVGIGLISYSAYLWHQALFAFARIRLHEPSYIIFLVLSFLSLILAYFSWRFIEKPFRNSTFKLGSKRYIFTLSAIGMFVLISIGLVGHVKDGFPGRVPPIIKKISDAGKPIKATCLSTQFKKLNECQIGKEGGHISFILIGDSHAGRYAYALEKLSQKMDFSFRVISGGWCAPLLNWNYTGNSPNPKCFSAMDASLKKIAKSDISRVVLSAEWGNYSQGYRYGDPFTNYVYVGGDDSKNDADASQFAKALRDTIKFLKSHGKEVLVIEPVPEYAYSIPNSMAKFALYERSFNELKIPLYSYKQRNKEFFDAFNQLELAGVERFNVALFFCDEKFCSPFSEQGLPLYSDGNHLSKSGLQVLQEALLKKIMK